MQIYPLLPSPLEALRRRHRLNRREAAERLGISCALLRVAEASTRRVSRPVLAAVAAAFEPPGPYYQLTIFDYGVDVAGGGEHV